MEREEVIVIIQELRAEVVHIVGICGRGTHPLTELIEKLERNEIDPEQAVVEAYKVRKEVADFR